MPTPLLAALCCALALPSDPARSDAAPPGLLPIEGGRTRVGSTHREIEELVREREELAFVLAGETPQFTREVDDFLLMPTEVTNEQYEQYVRATGARPPRSWAVRALQAGQAEFLEQQAKAKQAARESGEEFEPAEFDPEAWWAASWQDVAWEVPPDGRAHPVVFVSYADAQGYARWAGLRLMSEFEFQRAARGDSARVYPWGNQWDDRQYCQSLHSGKDLPAAVGSFAAGASGGIFDLAGNVWEWTSSPFDPFPGYEPLRVTQGRRTIECLAPFDPEQRVIVGGSFHMDKIGVRVATRMNTDRTQSTNALGFRCAASPRPGVDAANALIEQVLDAKVLAGAELEPESTVISRSWRTTPGRSTVAGYAVISAYEHVLFCPRADLPVNTVSDLADLSLAEGPVVLGFVDVPRPVLEPELDAGTYYVAWRAAGAPQQPPGDRQGLRTGPWDPREGDYRDVEGFTAERDCFVFYGPSGEPVAALPAGPPRIEKLRAGSVEVAREETGGRAADAVRFTLPLSSRVTRSKGFYFDLALRVAPAPPR